MFKPMFSLFLALAQTSGVIDKQAASKASQARFDSNEFLAYWLDNKSEEAQNVIERAFEDLKGNYKHEIEERKKYIFEYDNNELSEPQTLRVDKNLITFEKEEQALAQLSSPYLTLAHVRIIYKTDRGHACAFLQLENSLCWHFGNSLPTLYRRNEKTLMQQAQLLKQLIPRDKKPQVRVHLSRKVPLSYFFSCPQKILYTLDLDFTGYNSTVKM